MSNRVLTTFPFEATRQDDLDIFAEQLRISLPGLDVVTFVNPSTRKNEILVPQHIIDHINNFSDFLFNEIKDYIERGVNLAECTPLNGGLLKYYELMKRFSLYQSLLTYSNAPQFIFAAKNGSGKNQYSLSHIEGLIDVLLLGDDIYDEGGSSENIMGQVNARDHKRAEFFSTKVGRAHSQRAPIHVLPDKWIKTCYGMNGGLPMDNPDSEDEIEFAERECALPLMQVSVDDIRTWDDKQVQLYIDILRNSTVYERGSHDYNNYHFLLQSVQNIKDYQVKLEVMERINRLLITLITDGYHLDQIDIADFAQIEG